MKPNEQQPIKLNWICNHLKHKRQMKADENHYKLHWEFFQSINPKADEHFFVELQINEFDKRIKQGLKEIDFANDMTNTPESYENDWKRKNFFFYKEYKEFLEAKLIELKTKENLRQLPQLKNSIIYIMVVQISIQMNIKFIGLEQLTTHQTKPIFLKIETRLK